MSISKQDKKEDCYTWIYGRFFIAFKLSWSKRTCQICICITVMKHYYRFFLNYFSFIYLYVNHNNDDVKSVSVQHAGTQIADGDFEDESESLVWKKIAHWAISEHPLALCLLSSMTMKGRYSGTMLRVFLVWLQYTRATNCSSNWKPFLYRGQQQASLKSKTKDKADFSKQMDVHILLDIM